MNPAAGFKTFVGANIQQGSLTAKSAQDLPGPPALWNSRLVPEQLNIGYNWGMEVD